MLLTCSLRQRQKSFWVVCWSLHCGGMWRNPPSTLNNLSLPPIPPTDLLFLLLAGFHKPTHNTKQLLQLKDGQGKKTGNAWGRTRDTEKRESERGRRGEECRRENEGITVCSTKHCGFLWNVTLLRLAARCCAEQKWKTHKFHITDVDLWSAASTHPSLLL